MKPLYLVNPKPAAIDALIQYTLTKEDPLALGLETTELSRPKGEKIDVWQPLWSNSLFIAVLLTAGCFYMYRQDL